MRGYKKNTDTKLFYEVWTKSCWNERLGLKKNVPESKALVPE